MGSSTSTAEETWSRLLSTLAPDRAGQGAAYERLRARLVAFFRYKGARDPERLVDETFDRVAQKLDGGAELDLSSPIPYFLGVARFVGLEAQRAEAKSRSARPVTELPPEDPREKEALLGALEQCLEQLIPAQRQVVQRYHEGQGRARNRTRAELAKELGISENALRIRAHRLRAGLEACVQGRLDGETKDGTQP